MTAYAATISASSAGPIGIRSNDSHNYSSLDLFTTPQSALKGVPPQVLLHPCLRLWWRRHGVRLNGLAGQSITAWKHYALVRLALGAASDLPKEERGEAIIRAGQTPLTPRRRNRVTSEHLAEVARVYREAWEAGEHPTMAVRDHFGVSHSTAARWVGQARQKGKLRPPAEGSRGGEMPA